MSSPPYCLGIECNLPVTCSVCAEAERRYQVMRYNRRLIKAQQVLTNLGLVAVPREPTQEMLNAPLPESPVGSKYESRRDLRPLIYRAMIAAAPKWAEEQK